QVHADLHRTRLPLLANQSDFDAGRLAAAEVGFFFDDLPPVERLERADRDRTGRFQPTARSARNVAGIAIRSPSESRTESAAASATSARTSAMTLEGRRARAAWTRFVSRMTKRLRSGSIHIDVPVKPV